MYVIVFSVSAQEPYSKETVDRGLWIRVDANGKDVNINGKMNTAISFIEEQNTANVNANPWVGVNLQLTWGQLHNGNNYDQGIALIEAALDIAENENIFVQLNIADKYQSSLTNCGCDGNTCVDDYYLGSTPNIKDSILNRLEHQDFDEFKAESNATPSNPIICNNSDPKENEYYEAYHISDYRYARQQYVDEKNRFLRKYFSSRWNGDVKREWRQFWKKLGGEIGDHPALHSIITPESSNSFDAVKNEILQSNTNIVNPDNLFNYPGGRQYVSYLAYNSVKLREFFPANVLIINNTNWIFPNEKLDGNFYQEDVANKYLNQNLVLKNNNEEETIGWCSQDIVLSGSRVNAYNTRGVYEQMKRFPKKLRFGLVTGETRISDVDSAKIPSEVLKKTNDLGLSNLIFISKGNAAGYLDLIQQSKPGDYPFMLDATTNNVSYFITNRITGARLKLKDNQNDLTVTNSNDVSDSAKWKMVYENRDGYDNSSFQLFNQKTGEIIRYSTGGNLAGKIVKDNNTSIKWKTTFWKKVPAIRDGYFYLENLKSEKILKHDNVNNELIQASGIGGKSEWFFEDSSMSSRHAITKETSQITTNKRILIYPNPTTHNIKIRKNEDGEILMYSINGQLIKSYPENEDTINVSSLKNGIYFIKVNGNIGKFVKQ